MNTFLQNSFGSNKKSATASLRIGGVGIPVRDDEYRFGIFVNGKRLPHDGKVDGADISLSLSRENNLVTAEISVTAGEHGFAPDELSLMLGIDSYMVRYPEWEGQFFPTFMRCEKTHFWGYFCRMDGTMLAVCCPQKISSWKNHYNRVYYDEHNFDDPGHRIYTSSLDLISTLPQPKRHPKVLPLAPNETRKYQVYFSVCSCFDELNDFYSAMLGISLTRLNKWTIERGERVQIVGDDKNYFLFDGEGRAVDINSPLTECGSYYLVHRQGGMESEAVVFVREKVSLYLRYGALSSMEREQFASNNCECFYGYGAVFSYLSMYRDSELLNSALKKFDLFLNSELTEDKSDIVAAAAPKRVQNYTSLISFLVLAHRASGLKKYLDIAVKLADRFLLCQGEDGAYYSNGVHYTCVIYPAKSLFELYGELKNSGRKNEGQKYFTSAVAAASNLLKLKTCIGTEGEHTFEDGMITCEVLQLALCGLLVPESRQEFTAVAEEIYRKHCCLEHKYAPDARYRGATIRHWEAHYDILTSRNMITSPHGWTSWKTYGEYYLYLLTGKIEYLRNMFTTLGASMQTFDLKSGRQNWAFVVDPCVPVKRFERVGSGVGLVNRVVGEQYLPMISDWWRADPTTVTEGYGDPRIGTIPQGGCCDNDVYEHFKCLYEVGMQAFVHETESGLETYNCRVEGGEIILNDDLPCVRVYLTTPKTLSVSGKSYSLKAGMNVITTGGSNEL